MKHTRLVKILAVALVIAMLPLWAIGCKGKGGELGDKIISGFTKSMIGEGKLSTKDVASSVYLTKLDADVKNLCTYQMTNGAWALDKIEDGDTVAMRLYKNTYKMAVAWSTKGSAYYHSGEVLSKIKSALAVGYTDYFGEPHIAGNAKALTYTVRQTCSINLLKTILLMRDKLSKDEIDKYISIVGIKFPAPIGEGLDKLRTTYICLAYCALTGNKENMERFVGDISVDVAAYVNSGDGFYADGSYIWDLDTVSTLEGGVEAASILCDIAYALKGTKWELGEDIQNTLYNWVFNSMRYGVYNGTAMCSNLGLWVTKGDELGGNAVATMLKIAELCGGEKATAIKSLVKSYSVNSNGKFATGLGTNGAALYASVLKNKKITASTEIIGAHSYAAADTLALIGKSFSLSLSMNSTRTNKYFTGDIQNPDSTVDYNGNLWFLRDGMLALYTKEYSVSEDYWKNVNTRRLPGTTVDNRGRKDIHIVPYNGISNYAGSAVLGSTATSAMLVAGNNAEYVSDLMGKKAWFVFDDKIVCIGTDISNSTCPKETDIPRNHTQNIETVIENIYYGTNVHAFVGEDELEITSAETEIKAGSGLFFPKYGGIYIGESNTDVAKHKLNKTDGGNYVELWFEHGMAPSGASYEYAIYPSTAVSWGKFDDMIANGDMNYEVISNTEDVQAVKDVSGSIGYVFWNAASCNGVTTDFACTMMVKETEGQITVAISDFSHNSADNAGGTITIDGSFSLVRADNGLTLSGNSIVVDRAVAGAGQTLTIVLSK